MINSPMMYYFTVNQGQLDHNISFTAKTSFGSAIFFQDGYSYSLLVDNTTSEVISFIFVNAHKVAPIGTSALSHHTNYIYGSGSYTAADFNEIVYYNLWDGIDLHFLFQDGQLKYEYRVHADADVGKIGIKVAGATMATNGMVLTMVSMSTTVGLTDEPLVAYYADDRSNVAASFKVAGEIYSFAVENRDLGRELVIDPLIYSTYIGGTGDDRGKAIAVDTSGCVYVTGSTYSSNFPTIPGAYNRTYNAYTDVFILKLSADGSSLIYSTYVGGSDNDADTSTYCQGIAVDTSDCAFVAGTTRSSNFPTTPGAYQTTINAGNNDLFILKLSADGSSLVYSTFLGGSGFDEGTSIAIDPSGNAYVTGTTYSSNFPTTPGAYNRTIQGVQNDAFALKLSSNGSSLVYSTYIGGTLGDYGNAITLDSSGFVYITGETTSTNFPTSPGAYQTTNKGSYEVFIFKLNSDMSSLVYSTYIGGGGTDSSKAIVVDTSGNAYVTGSTTSVNFPTTLGAYQTTRKSTIDAFVSKLSSNGSSLVYSTYIGGTGSEYGNGINVDSSGNAYMTGYTGSSNFPTTTGAYQATNGGSNDVFVLRLNSTGSKIIYSTLIGGSSADYGCGIAIDSYACAHLTGYTASTNFPTTPGANQTANMGSYDAFVLDIPCYTVPLAPTLNALAGNTQASLSWNVPDDMGANIDYYLVYQDGVEVANLTTNSTVVTDLINGQSYSFTVSAHNAAGLGQLSNAAACIPYTIPDAPTLDAVAGDAQVVLTWTAPSDNGRTIDYYLIYQEGAEIVNLTNTSATITGLTNGLSYPFTVVAHNQGGLSAESNVAIVVPFTVPGAPTNLVAVPGNAQVMLSWTAPNNNGRTIDYYLVYNQDTGLEVDNVTAASATISGLTNGLQYNFTVYAHNEGGLSAESNTATATPYTVPNAPTITSAIAGNDQVTLTWTVPYNGGTTIDYYLVYQDGVALPTHYIATTTTITGLSNGVSYSFAVSAVTVAGEGEKSSIVSAIPFTVPDAPTNLVATPGNGLASLTWTVPNDNGRTIDYYLVYQDGVEVANVATTSTTVTGLVNGQSYSFTVAAHNAAGLGTQSSAAVSVPYTIPDAPVLNAVGCNAQVSLSWNAPADNGAAIDYYLVYQDCVEVANVTTTLTT